MKSSASTTAQVYRFAYTYRPDHAKQAVVTRELSTMATSAIQALNYFHEHLQRHNDYDASRNVVRPKLAPSDYTLTLFKRDGMAPYELPVGGNPDLSRRVKAPKAQTTDFDFVGAIPVGRNPDADRPVWA